MFATKRCGMTVQRAVFTRNMLNSMKIISKPQMITPLIISQPQRLFSSIDLIEKSTQKLNKALESEVKYEQENYSQLEDIETFLNESGFMFKETDGGLQMSLHKAVGDKKIEVVFDAR